MSFLSQFLTPVAIGILSSALAVLAQLPASARFASSFWQSPWAPLAAAAVAALLCAIARQARVPFDGLADLFAHIHQPAHPDSPSRWRVRALISLALAATGRAGAEGPAIEAAQAAGISGRTLSTQWSEQTRRTDAAVAVAAGAAAALGAPFAGAILALELGVGGRALSAVLAALAAGFAARGAGLELGIATHEDWGALVPAFEWAKPLSWGALAVGALTSAFVLAFVLKGASIARAGFVSLERNLGIYARLALAGALLSLIALIHHPAGFTPFAAADATLWDQAARGRALPEFLAQALSFIVLVAGFGTSGVLAPVFAIGVAAGTASGALVFGAPSHVIFCGLAAAVAAWTCGFSAPISACVLLLEVTDKPLLAAALFPAALLSLKAYPYFRGRSLVERQLRDRSVRVQGGRSLDVLESITTQEAMITDFNTVEDQSSIEDVWTELRKSPCPFLPVIDRQGKFLGLLTYETIQEAWQLRNSPEQAAHAPLTSLLEAKDLLYRSNFTPPTARLDEPLSRVASVLNYHPCLPVLDKDRRILGLLFAYSVRLAYDRAVARRSLELETRGVFEETGT